MMFSNSPFSSIFTIDFIKKKNLLIGVILLFITAHSFLMNGFSHVSRFLTVALYVNPIEAKNNPTLFRNSLFVQSDKEKKARLSLMHELSPYILRNFDLEKFALIQWIICLFFTSIIIFFLGKTLTDTYLAGFGSVLLFCSNLNNWTLGSPAIYINFFHHGLQWAIALNILSLLLVLCKKYPAAFFFHGPCLEFTPHERYISPYALLFLLGFS